MHTERTTTTRLPPSFGIAAATVHFPATLGAVLEGPGHAGGRAVDLAVMEWVPSVAGLAVAPITVSFLDAGSAAPIAVRGLQDPVTISWEVANASALRQPLADWYQCVYEVCLGGRHEQQSVARRRQAEAQVEAEGQGAAEAGARGKGEGGGWRESAGRKRQGGGGERQRREQARVTTEMRRTGKRGIFLKGRGLWGQFQSSYRGTVKRLGGGYWRLEERPGLVLRYNAAFGVESWPKSWRHPPPPFQITQLTRPL